MNLFTLFITIFLSIWFIGVFLGFLSGLKHARPNKNFHQINIENPITKEIKAENKKANDERKKIVTDAKNERKKAMKRFKDDLKKMRRNR